MAAAIQRENRLSKSASCRSQETLRPTMKCFAETTPRPPGSNHQAVRELQMASNLTLLAPFLCCYCGHSRLP
jgi:hypothetical protein